MQKYFEKVNNIKLQDAYESEIERYVVELLYRIKLAKEYLSACDVYREEVAGCNISKLKLANDFFVTVFEALNTAMMIEIAKLCEDQSSSCSVIRFFKRCQSDKTFSGSIADKCAFNSLVKKFFDFLEKEDSKNIIENIKIRRDKYYAHSDKIYFTDIDQLVQNTTLCYDDIGYLLNKFNVFCLKAYKLAKDKDWEPHLHQGCIERKRNCNDLVNLLNRVKIEGVE